MPWIYVWFSLCFLKFKVYFLWHLSQYSYNYSNCINIVYCLPRLWEHILDSLIFGQHFVLLVICINKSYFLQKCFEELDPKKCFWLCLFVLSCQSFLFSAHLILRRILAFSEINNVSISQLKLFIIHLDNITERPPSYLEPFSWIIKFPHAP